MIRIALISLGFALGLALQADAGLFHPQAGQASARMPGAQLAAELPAAPGPAAHPAITGELQPPRHAPAQGERHRGAEAQRTHLLQLRTTIRLVAGSPPAARDFLGSPRGGLTMGGSHLRRGVDRNLMSDHIDNDPRPAHADAFMALARSRERDRADFRGRWSPAWKVERLRRIAMVFAARSMVPPIPYSTITETLKISRVSAHRYFKMGKKRHLLRSRV